MKKLYVTPEMESLVLASEENACAGASAVGNENFTPGTGTWDAIKPL